MSLFHNNPYRRVHGRLKKAGADADEICQRASRIGVSIDALDDFADVLEALNRDYKQAVRHEHLRQLRHWWMRLRGRKYCEICPCSLEGISA